MAIVNGYVRERPAKSLTESWCTKKKWFDKKMERAINLIHSYPGRKVQSVKIFAGNFTENLEKKLSVNSQ